MNWRETPLLRLLLPFALGIALADWFAAWLPLPMVWLSVGLLVVLALANRNYQYGTRWVFGVVLYVFLLLFGYAYALSFNELCRVGHFSEKPGQPLHFAVGILDDVPAKGTRLRVPVKIEAAGPAADSLRPAFGKVLVYLDTLPANAALGYGDRIAFRAKIQPVEPPKNPNAFDYRRYLHFQNIHFQAFVKPDSAWVLSHGHGNWFWQTAYCSRARLLDLLREHFPTPDEHAVAAALLLGYKEELSDEVRAAYTDTGSMHALAVSGTHVGMIFVALIFVFRRVPMPPRFARFLEPLAVLLFIWGFTLLTGATASVVRAAVMFSLMLVGRAAWRDVSIWNIVAGAAFCQMLFNPFWLFDAGFQLSYAAVAGMVFFYPRFLRWSPVFRWKWLDWLWSSLLVGVAAQLGTLPLSLFYFHQFPVYFWLSGWVVIMGGAVFLYGCFFLVVFAKWLPMLAGLLGKGLYALVLGMNWLIFGIQKLPFALLDGIWLTAGAAALCYLALAFLAAASVSRQVRWLVAGLSVLVVLGAGRAAHHFSNFDQRKITVYSLSRRSLVDFFDGERLVALADSMPEKQVKFAALAHRTASGSREPLVLSFGKDTVCVTSNLFWQPPVAQFFGKKLAVVDDPKWLANPNAAPLRVDAVLLHGNPRVTVEDCARRFDCRFFVFDGSNSWSRAEKWKAACRAAGFAWHDVRQQGAWVLEF